MALGIFVYDRGTSHPVPAGLPLNEQGMGLMRKLIALPAADTPEARLARENLMREQGFVLNPHSGQWEMPIDMVVGR